MQGPIQISLLGDVVVTVDGVPQVGGGSGSRLGPLAQVAFAALVLQRDRLTPREELADIVWGDALPTTWRSALRGLTSRLRTVLTSTLDSSASIINVAGSYRLTVPADTVVDIEAADAALAAGCSRLDGDRDPCLAREQLVQAVTLTAGEFLAQASTPWVLHRRAQVRECHIRSLEALSDAAVACGDHSAALQAAETAVSLEPLRESAHVRIMAAHAAAGNRGEAIRAYHRCRTALTDELGISPSAETEAAYQRLLSEQGAIAQGGAGERRRLTNVPARLDRFIEPPDTLLRLKSRLANSRLLTLTGPAGIGKSRLALELSRAAATSYPDGVWFIDLARLPDARSLAQDVCSTLGIRPATDETPLAAICRHVSNRQLLLLLDNCESLLQDAAILTETLLQTGPGVTVLSTTRQALGIPGEAIWTVAPLAVPDRPGKTLRDIWEYGAVRLFVDRATAVAADLEPEHEADTVAQICQRLEGVPLAIELAAAHARTLDLSEIAARLGDHLGFLAVSPGASDFRRSLRATLEWSCESLRAEERRLLARLAVFAGGFDLRSAEAVCELRYVASLEGLVARSLVVARRHGGKTWYRMLEPVRQFAAAMLADSGDERTTRERHLVWAHGLARAAAEQMKGSDQQRWIDRLDAEHHNLLAALSWAAAVPDQRPTALELAVALWRFWELRGYLTDGRMWLETLACDTESGPVLRAQALNAAAILAHHQSDYPAARNLYNAAVELWRQLGDRAGIAACLNGLGHLAVSQGDFGKAEAIFSENVAIATQIADERLRAGSLMNLAVAVQLLGNTATSAAEGRRKATQARGLHRRALAAYRGLGDAHGTAMTLENLGALACAEGLQDEARHHLDESLAIRRVLGDRIGICGCHRFLGELALRSGDHDSARGHLGESLEIALELGSKEREGEARRLLAKLPPYGRERDETRVDPATRRAKPLRAPGARGEIEDASGR